MTTFVKIIPDFLCVKTGSFMMTLRDAWMSSVCNTRICSSFLNYDFKKSLNLKFQCIFICCIPSLKQYKNKEGKNRCAKREHHSSSRKQRSISFLNYIFFSFVAVESTTLSGAIWDLVKSNAKYWLINKGRRFLHSDFHYRGLLKKIFNTWPLSQLQPVIGINRHSLMRNCFFND